MNNFFMKKKFYFIDFQSFNPSYPTFLEMLMSIKV